VPLPELLRQAEVLAKADDTEGCERERALLWLNASLAKAQFLKDHREQLVDKMIEGDVGRRTHKIDCFLIFAFKAGMQPA